MPQNKFLKKYRVFCFCWVFSSFLTFVHFTKHSHFLRLRRHYSSAFVYKNHRRSKTHGVRRCFTDDSEPFQKNQRLHSYFHPILKKKSAKESDHPLRLIRAGYSWTLSRYRFTWRLLSVPFRALNQYTSR